jgi:hypothetical protein
VKARIEAVLADLPLRPRQGARIKREAGAIAEAVAAWPVLLPGRVRARAAVCIVALVYEALTGKRASRIWNEYEAAPVGFIPFVESLFDKVGIKASAERTVRNHADLRKALEPRLDARHAVARRGRRDAFYIPWLWRIDSAFGAGASSGGQLMIAPRENAVSFLARIARTDPFFEFDLARIDRTLAIESHGGVSDECLHRALERVDAVIRTAGDNGARFFPIRDALTGEIQARERDAEIAAGLLEQGILRRRRDSR